MWPSDTPEFNTVTLEFASAIPDQVGVLSFVKLSPVNVGALGAVWSFTVMIRVAVPVLLPSDAESVREWEPELLSNEPAVLTTPEEELIAKRPESLPDAIAGKVLLYPHRHPQPAAVINCVPAESVSLTDAE